MLRDSRLGEVLRKIASDHSIPLDDKATVLVGRDTRKSSPSLSQAVLDGVRAVGGAEAVDFGVVSTPQLHYNVVCRNTGGAYGEEWEEGYFKKLAEAFKRIRGAVRDTFVVLSPFPLLLLLLLLLLFLLLPLMMMPLFLLLLSLLLLFLLLLFLLALLLLLLTLLLLFLLLLF